jgi:hypothetical protein
MQPTESWQRAKTVIGRATAARGITATGKRIMGGAGVSYAIPRLSYLPYFSSNQTTREEWGSYKVVPCVHRRFPASFAEK